MSNITQVLTVFGENFYLVVVLCVEILIAVLLFGMTITKNMRISKRKTSVRGVESEFLEAMDRRPDEVLLCVSMISCLFMRAGILGICSAYRLKMYGVIWLF